MSKLSRRRFLGFALAGGALIAVPWAWFKWTFGDPTDIVVAVLRRRVGYLRNPPDAFRTFARSYLEYKSEYRDQLSKLSIIALPFTFLTVYRWLPIKHPLRRLEDNVVSNYLLSTDFFHHGADPDRQLTYVGFWDPQAIPCRNPFARKASEVGAG